MSDVDTVEPKPSIKTEKKLPIIEIFGPTVQGEGLVAGQRTIFIRFGLCDYKCKMCDSMHAVDPRQVKENATWLTQYELADKVLSMLASNNCRNVTYSGGNPCIHDLNLLTATLDEAGVNIALETQGTMFPEWAYMCHWITVSPKSPGMGEQFEADKFQNWVNRFAGDPHFCVKIVVFSAEDLEFAAAVAQRDNMKRIIDDDRFYLSQGNPYPPSIGEEGAIEDPDPDMMITLFDHTLEDLKGYPALAKARFLPQVHVLLWGNKRGK